MEKTVRAAASSISVKELAKTLSRTSVGQTREVCPTLLYHFLKNHHTLCMLLRI